MTKISVSLICEWSIAVAAASGGCGIKRLEHGEPPKGDGSPARAIGYVASTIVKCSLLAASGREDNINSGVTYPATCCAQHVAGFERLYRPTKPGGNARLIEVACWSHARRGFYEVHHATASPIALEALERIAALFAIESAIRGQPPERRATVRQEHARPLHEQLKVFLETSLRQVSGKSALAKAIRYALSRWKALTRYNTDGRLEMSNNAAERAMRSPVLGRRNYLFCGSDAGGRRAACIYTIIETCKLNGIDPQAYLTDILGRIGDHPIKRIDELLPWRWKK